MSVEKIGGTYFCPYCKTEQDSADIHVCPNEPAEPEPDLGIPRAVAANTIPGQIYRKRPVVITAQQFLEGQPIPKGVCFGWKCGGDPSAPHVHTIHDNQRVDVVFGDWIVPGPDGEHYYPVKDDIFWRTYERCTSSLPNGNENQPESGVKGMAVEIRRILKERSCGEVETPFIAAFMEMIDEAEKKCLSENASKSSDGSGLSETPAPLPPSPSTAGMQEALKGMVELWDLNHPEEACACVGKSDDCTSPPLCELCIARAVLEKKEASETNPHTDLGEPGDES